MIDRNALQQAHDDRYIRVSRALIDHVRNRTTQQHPEGPRFFSREEYRSDDLHRRELELFRTVPTVFASSGEIPNAGDYQAKAIAGVNVLVVRDAAGIARVFLNACPHRGAVLAEGAGKLPGNRIVCPYHAWTFKSDGSLLAVAEKSHFGGLDGACFDLISLPCEERHGLVFSMLDSEATIDLDEFLGSFDQVLAELNLDAMPHIIRREMWQDPMNWKFALSTYCENYHFTFLHKDTVGVAIYPDTSIYEKYGQHAAYYTAARNIPDLQNDDDETLLQKKSAGTSAFTGVHFLFPNTIITGFGRRLGSHVVTITPGTMPSEQSTEFRLVGAPPVDEEVRTQQEAYADITFFAGHEEDYHVMSAADQNVAAGIHPGVTFGANEPLLTEIHRGWARAIGRDNPDLAVGQRPRVVA